MSRSFKLFRLQQVDSQLDQALARLKEIESIMGEDEILRQANDLLASAEDLVTLSSKDLRSAEEEVKAQQIKVEQNQSTLYSGAVKNPKELQDLQSESAALNRHLESLENVQLEKMLVLEDAQSAQNEAGTTVGKIEAERAVEHGELGIERQQLREEAERLSGERDAAGKGIDAKDSAVYEALRASKAGLAVAKVKEKTCSACGTLLSESLAQASRSPEELSNCSTCKRILYSG